MPRTRVDAVTLAACHPDLSTRIVEQDPEPAVPSVVRRTADLATVHDADGPTREFRLVWCRSADASPVLRAVLAQLTCA